MRRNLTVGAREARALRRRLRRRDALRGIAHAAAVVVGIVAFGLAYGACALYCATANEPPAAKRRVNPLAPYEPDPIAALLCDRTPDPWQCHATLEESDPS